METGKLRDHLNKRLAKTKKNGTQSLTMRIEVAVGEKLLLALDRLDWLEMVSARQQAEIKRLKTLDKR